MNGGVQNFYLIEQRIYIWGWCSRGEWCIWLPREI